MIKTILVYLLACAGVNTFIHTVLEHIVVVSTPIPQWLEFTNLSGPSFWANLVLLFSMIAASFFLYYGENIRKITAPSDVKGGFGWWIVLFVFPTLVCSVVAFVSTLPQNSMGVIAMLILYTTIGVGLYWITTLLWAPPSVKMAPFFADKIR